MSKILKVGQGDYRIQVPDYNSITLDTGVHGSVVITGDLDIKGQTTTIESVNATVKDNILVLNKDEPHTNGAGITLGSAGIQIDRGYDSAVVLSAKILFDEAVNHYNPITNAIEAGTYTLSTSRDSANILSSLQVSSIELSAISSNGTNTNGIALNLRNTNTTITVINSVYNTLPYHKRVISDSLVNKEYVTDYVIAGQMTEHMADVDKIYYKNGTVKSQILATNTDLQFSINTIQRAVMNNDGLSVDTINLYGTTVKNTGVNPLILTSDINLVEVNGTLALDDQASAPTLISGKTQIYSSATAGSGKSGIFFKNDTTSDELVAKNRALLLSMLF